MNEKNNVMPHKNDPIARARRIRLAIELLVLSAICAVVAIFGGSVDDQPVPTLVKPVVEVAQLVKVMDKEVIAEPVVEAVVAKPRPPFLHKEAIERARPHIEKAARDNQKALDEAIAGIRTIFTDMHKGVPGFAEEINSLSSKWRLMRYMVNDTWNQKVRHRESTRVSDRVVSRFRKHIITEKQLERRITQVIEDLDYKLAAAHNRMLVAVQTEIMSERPGEGRLPDVNSQELYRILETVCARQRAELLKLSFAGEAASLVLGEIATQVILRVFISMSGGAAGSVAASVATTAATTVAGKLAFGAATFGVGLLVSVGIDMVISNYSEKRMVKQMNAAISDMEQQVIAGNAEAAGLRMTLTRYIHTYNKAQAMGIEKAIWGLE